MFLLGARHHSLSFLHLLYTIHYVLNLTDVPRKRKSAASGSAAAAYGGYQSGITQPIDDVCSKEEKKAQLGLLSCLQLLKRCSASHSERIVR